MRAWRSLAAVDIRVFLAPSKLPLGMAAASCASLLCLGNQRDPSAKQIQRSGVTNFFLLIYLFIIFSPPSFSEKLLETFLKGLFSATSFLLHHCEHCNIIKLVKRKQWCLSFSQTARCSFRGETASCMDGGGQDSSAFFLSNKFCFQNKQAGSLPKNLLWIHACRSGWRVSWEGFSEGSSRRSSPIGSPIAKCFWTRPEAEPGCRILAAPPGPSCARVGGSPHGSAAGCEAGPREEKDGPKRPHSCLSSHTRQLQETGRKYLYNEAIDFIFIFSPPYLG